MTNKLSLFELKQTNPENEAAWQALMEQIGHYLYVYFRDSLIEADREDVMAKVTINIRRHLHSIGEFVDAYVKTVTIREAARCVEENRANPSVPLHAFTDELVDHPEHAHLMSSFEDACATQSDGGRAALEAASVATNLWSEIRPKLTPGQLSYFDRLLAYAKEQDPPARKMRRLFALANDRDPGADDQLFFQARRRLEKRGITKKKVVAILSNE